MPQCPAEAAGLWSPWDGQRDCPTGQAGMAGLYLASWFGGSSWFAAPREFHLIGGGLGHRDAEPVAPAGWAVTPWPPSSLGVRWNKAGVKGPR
jgi:hypothetical protein